jgi:inner membrane protein
MDPIAHTLAGAALASSGLPHPTPLATATLVLAANAPDIDIVTQFFGSYTSLAHRRGWTHGVLALALWPFVLTSAIVGWDRAVRRKRDPTSAPVLPKATFLLATLAVLSHPALDWLNTYGMRWLMPFDGRWFYGDALFIVDPWVWLLLGGALFLQHSSRRSALVGWAAFWIAASALVLLTPLVPSAARFVWVAGLLFLVVVRAFAHRSTREPPGRADRRELPTRIAVVATTAYIVLMITLTAAASAETRRALLEAGEPAGDVMAGPLPANPFVRALVAEVPRGFRFGEYHLFRSIRVQLRPELLERGPGGPAAAAAARDPDARDFLVWARFPFTRVTELPDGYEVLIGDARAPAGMGRGPLAGVTVRLDSELRPRPSVRASPLE